MPMVLVLEERGEKAGGPPTTPFQPTTTFSSLLLEPKDTFRPLPLHHGRRGRGVGRNAGTQGREEGKQWVEGMPHP